MAHRDNAAKLRDYAGTDMMGSCLLKFDKKITSAQVLAINTTPVLVAATTDLTTDTGMGFVVSHVVAQRPAGTGYSAVALLLRYGTAGNTIFSFATSLITGTTDTTIVVYPDPSAVADQLTLPSGVVGTSGLFISAASNPTTGNFAVYFSVYGYLTPVNLSSRF
jgi:hypothetical protein